MKKKVDDDAKGFSSVKLYKKDVEELFDIFTSTFGSYRLSDSKYEYDSFNEVLEKKGPVLKELTITSPSSSLILTFGSECSLRRTGEPEAVAAFPKVLTLLKDCGRPVLGVVLHFAAYIITVTIIVAVLIVSGKFRQENVQAWFLLFALLGIFPFYAQHVGYFSRLVLTEKHEEQTFLKRNRDNLWLLIVGAVIGSILTYIPTVIRWVISLFRG